MTFQKEELMLKRQILKESGLGKKKVKIPSEGKVTEVRVDPTDQGGARTQMPRTAMVLGN